MEFLKSVKLVTLIMTISFLFVYKTGRSQDMYLKSFIEKRIQPPSITLREDYFYDDTWQLDSVIYTWQGGNTTNYYYSRDSLINIKFSNGELIQLTYYEDSIVQYNVTQNKLQKVYHLDFEKKVVRNDYYADGIYDWTAYNTWENGNCTHLTTSNGWYQNCTYSQNLLNPKFKAYRYLKEGNFDRGGCVNYIRSTDGPESWNYELFIVEDSLNSYPTLVTTYQMGEPNYEYTYDYFIVVDIPENGVLSEKVISVQYFDYMGKEIDKPEHGFYIEMKQTAKGFGIKKIFQTKY